MDPVIYVDNTYASKEDFFNPIGMVLQFLASYGWLVVGAGALLLYVAQRLRPGIQRRRDAREEAEHHRNPDAALARLEALQRARELQQRRLEEASQRALELQREREEKRRLEAAERMRKYGPDAGQKLGSGDDYLPLSAGASTSSYRPPKKSKCGGGGCGR
ncbi:uncharacterized protein LOC113505434 isoform X2 [Trichoplusia ni]|uniref:Uncharacterized protein LOC113505434 isoform X2 n=1 Tax=Trichoplusia ni TaxID=7111 RepID=A0A7E5WUS0_TRINI|nr:uncharacterized protein LOC113505434 isoform X2 [Trichoplusia ni]